MRDYSTRLNSIPSSSQAGSAVTGIHTYVSPWRRWARITGALCGITSIIFSCLAVASYSNFNNLVSDISALPGEGDPLGVPTDVWTSLFAGAAASAVFAVVLTVLNITLSTLLLCCARQSVAHPQRTLSKSFLVASCWFAMLHIANITSQFYSFLPLMGVLTSKLAVSFNRSLLTTTVVFGLLDTLFYLLFGLVLVPWVERPDLLQVDMAPSSPRV